MKFTFNANKAYEDNPRYPRGFEDGQVVELPESFTQFPWWIPMEEEPLAEEPSEITYVKPIELVTTTDVAPGDAIILGDKIVASSEEPLVEEQPPIVEEPPPTKSKTKRRSKTR